MKLTIRKFLFFILLFANAILTALTDTQPKLKFVNVVFRHGDRTPDATEMFPNDLNSKNEFYPMGYGGLTNEGKRREYQLGKLLRDKYNDFLGDVYLPQSVFARSTDYARTKMCLQLVLAGLYPPATIQKWNKELNWQPIPATFVPLKDDWLMAPEECPKFKQLRIKLENTPEVASKIKKFEKIGKNLSNWTGKNMSRTYDMYLLYHLLTAEAFLNCSLPTWSKNLFPYGELYEVIKFEYQLVGYTKTLRKFNGGKLLYKIVESMKKVKDGTAEKNHKISLYSGHETNIAALLQVLDVFKPHVPAYSSAVLVEFYELNSKYFVKILYYRGIPSKFIVQKIPGCDILCPFDTFLNLLKDVTPSSDELDCDKISDNI